MAKNTGKRRIDEDEAKDDVSALDVPQLSEQQQRLIDAQVKLQERAEIASDAATLRIMQPFYENRRAAVKNIPHFWGTALAQHEELVLLSAGQDDLKALRYLTDLWVEYDKLEPRVFTLHFEFSENPYFTDKVLKKEYKYTPPNGTPAPGTGVDANGVSDAQEAFEWETHVTPQAIKINWKDDTHNLTKLFPRVVSPEDSEDVEEFGSFFNFFEHAADARDIGQTIVQDLYPAALRYFLGESHATLNSDDEIDSEDEDDEDDEDEIDLEQPRKKKPKQA